MADTYGLKNRKNPKYLSQKDKDAIGKESIRNKLVDAALFGNSFMPITGDIQSGLQAVNDLKNKDYGSAALNGLGILPFIPSLGGMIKSVQKGELSKPILDILDNTKHAEQVPKALETLRPLITKENQADIVKRLVNLPPEKLSMDHMALSGIGDLMYMDYPNLGKILATNADRESALMQWKNQLNDNLRGTDPDLSDWIGEGGPINAKTSHIFTGDSVNSHLDNLAIRLPYPLDIYKSSEVKPKDYIQKKWHSTTLDSKGYEHLGDTVKFQAPANTPIVLSHGLADHNEILAPLNNIVEGKNTILKTPYEMAMEEAHREGVARLGLPEGHTAMDRAKAMGYNTKAYIGRDTDYKALDPDMPKANRKDSGNWASEEKEVANSYAGRRQGNVMPVLINTEGFPKVDFGGKSWAGLKEAPKITDEKGGIIEHLSNLVKSTTKTGQPTTNDYGRAIKNNAHGLKFVNVQDQGGFVNGVAHTAIPESYTNYAIQTPNRVRSINAAFNPAKRYEDDLLGNATPEMMGVLSLLSALGIGYKIDADK